MKRGSAPARRNPLKSDPARPSRLVRVTIVLPKWLYDEIEGRRGLVKRSTFIADLLQKSVVNAEAIGPKAVRRK